MVVRLRLRLRIRPPFMSGETSVAAARARLLTQVLPNGVPALWCPPLTHYDRDGGIDGARIEAHLRFLAPHVNGFLKGGLILNLNLNLTTIPQIWIERCWV